jgi:rod shape-determining protein MreC
LASITLLTVGASDAPVVRDVREATSVVVEPVHAAADTVTRPFRNAWRGVTNYDELERENDRLRAQLAEVEAGQVRASDAETQLAELSEALDLSYVGDIPTVAARVTSGPLSNFSTALEIDRGADDGLATDMPVVTAAGLVGRISRVTSSSATVELLTTPDFHVGVRVGPTGELGTAQGRGAGQALIVDTSIDPESEVADGTGVVTSGVDRSLYPAGIPVGEVTSTSVGSGGLALDLTVKPLVDVDRLSFVSVLRWEPPA